MINHQNTTLGTLEAQIGLIALELRNRPVGTLPSDTEVPKTTKEQVKDVRLRSGKDLVGTIPKTVSDTNQEKPTTTVPPIVVASPTNRT